MFTRARIKLTLFYSLLFLFVFWLFSLGVYFWMESSFGESYISQVKQKQAQQGQFQGQFADRNTTTVIIAGDVALSQLGSILLTINGLSLLIIPAISWYLAGKNLKPIEIAHEKQKQFVSDASHELRTPLSIISGEIEVALRGKRSIQEYQQILESNKRELSHLTALVENLLFLARDDQNRAASSTDIIDLTDLLATLIVRVKPLAKVKGLAVHFRFPQESTTVLGNSQLLRQLFFNLLDNAFKYTKKGKVIVSLTRESKHAKVAVKDTGIGIATADQDKLFDRFYRVDHARSGTKGYGLGLAICRRIVKAHRGTISVTSTPGKGTTFTVSLPTV